MSTPAKSTPSAWKSTGWCGTDWQASSTVRAPTACARCTSVRTGAMWTTATVARSVFPTFDGNVAAEDRASARFDGALGDATFAVAPFATRTRTWTRDVGSYVDHALGVTAALGVPLSDLLRADVYGEFGLSPYARLDGDRAPRAAVGGQVLVALTARVAR